MKMITIMARMTIIVIIVVQNIKNAIPKPHLVSSFIETFCNPHTRSTERRAHAAARTHAAMASGEPTTLLRITQSQNGGFTKLGGALLGVP